MKILQLISSVGFFGAENVLIELSKKLCSSKYNFCIGTINNHSNPHIEVTKEALKNNLTYKIFDCRGKFDIKTISKIRKYIKENKIDIIHSHGYKSNIYGFFASVNLDIQRIATCHNWLGNNMKMKLYEYLDKLVLNRFNKVVAVSDTLKDEILSSGIPKNKVVVINNGIDTNRFQSQNCKSQTKALLGIQENEKVIGTIGRLTPEKGQLYLLKAFKMANSKLPNTKLLIIGDGPLRRSLELEATGLELRDNVIFTGIRNDIPEILNIMDVFVLSSLNEGLPMALLEAMAAQIPSIATNVGAISKVIDNGYSGLLVEAMDVIKLTDTMVNLLTDKDSADYLAKNAYATVKSNFSSENMAKEYAEIYDSLIKYNN